MTRKQRAFINHYIKCKNGAEAVRLAGYSEKGANRMANILLSNIDIKTEIDKKFEEIAKGLQITKENVLKFFWEKAHESQSDRDQISAMSEVAVILGYKKSQDINLIQQVIHSKEDKAELKQIKDRLAQRIEATPQKEADLTSA